ncbi:MAG: hypothetical protein ACR2ID_09615 [Chthoniobacterales bacterium]
MESARSAPSARGAVWGPSAAEMAAARQSRTAAASKADVKAAAAAESHRLGGMAAGVRGAELRSKKAPALAVAPSEEVPRGQAGASVALHALAVAAGPSIRCCLEAAGAS